MDIETQKQLLIEDVKGYAAALRARGISYTLPQDLEKWSIEDLDELARRLKALARTPS